VARALEGIRVIDLTVWFQGPVSAQYLADFGAEVIKVERPQGGDQARGVRSIKSLEIGDWNQYFLVINRNKKSMAIDLRKKPEGQADLYRLVEKCDVFLSNLARAARRLGLVVREAARDQSAAGVRDEYRLRAFRRCVTAFVRHDGAGTHRHHGAPGRAG
jgi:crotonobetainyl-CoA:carnitine CoA-transferase CaiB-like acyl-CoA transferase